MMRIYDAKINHLENPLGFRMMHTVFSWKVADAEGTAQAWARIRVAADEAFTQMLYDSGCDEAASALAWPVVLPLEPRSRYYWKVTVRTDAGEEAESAIQWFETAKQDEAWEGKWITCGNNTGTGDTEKRHPFFEKDILPGKKVEKARLYVCGLGLYEAFWNGEKIGGEYLTPYSNDYNEWIQYQTFDVTKQLKTNGKLSILLGNGWYKSRFGFAAKEDVGFYGNEWKLIAEVRLTFADGTEAVIGTDESWTVRRSNILFSNLYDGEIVDDTLEELSQEQAVLTDAPKGELTARMSLPVHVHEVFEPVELIHTPAGETVLDMGQEFTGIFTLKVNEPAGTRIHIQTGEILQQGNFYNENLRTAKSEYIYVSNGEEAVIKPHFTFYGYRYVKVQGISNLKKEDFKGLALYSELMPVGSMKTGHPLVNRFIENVRWGLQSNFVDVPTDCPQRDERMGWTGDAQVFSSTAMYLKDCYAFYAKYLYDMAREQAALDGKVPDVVPSCGVESTACVWGDAACIIPWNMYVFYGDKSILEDQFASMKAWVDYIRRVDGDNHGWRYVFHYGDWLALDNPQGGAEQTFGGTDEEFIANLYYAVSAGLVAKAAGVLGLWQDEEEYRLLSEEQFEVVKREYYSATGRCCIKTQTALLLTLKYGLSGNVELTKRQLRKLFEDNGGKLKTGFVGTPLMCNILSDNGMNDLAYSLLLNEEYPGWLHEVKLGATTVWERWNSLLDDGTISGISMNSMNHYAYGAVLEWMFRHAAGIDVAEDAPGGTVVRMEPLPHMGLGYLEASYDAQAGRYQVRWELTDAEHINISVTVPFGCQALLKLPMAREEIYRDSANPIFSDVRDGICHLRTGSYQVQYRLVNSMKQTSFDVEEVLSRMTLEEKAQMCSGRDFWKTQDIKRLGVPSVMMCDGPNGLRKQLGKGDHLGINAGIETVCYPTASATASSFDRELIKELGEGLGAECQAENVGMLLGPGVNMKRSPLCGRNFEYFSEDPYLAGQMASAYIKGLQSKGVASCVKHFAANNQETRRMSGSSQVDERTLHEIYLPAFEAAVREGGTRGIMCAYNAVNGIFCAENKELLTDILREDWGYEGFVVTDWGAVKDRVKGLKAGLDLEMPGSTEGKTEAIVAAVGNGELEESVLDAAVRNVLKFVKDAVENQEKDASIDREEQHRKSIRYAGECAVLLKNENGVLPFLAEQKVAFIGAFAENPRYQGAGSSHINVRHPVAAMECVEGLEVTFARGYNPDNETEEEALVQEAVRVAENADTAVIFAGLPDAYESEGFDRDHMRMPKNQNRLITEIAKVQKNTVVVLHGGSSIVLPWREDVAAILMMHLGGDGVGQAAVDLLYGRVNPSGKLAETWPLMVEDNPSYLNFPGEEGAVEYHEGIFIGYRYYDKKAMEVQYPFGHGLSYTSFAYSDLKADRESMSDSDTLRVSVKVKNTGNCFGKEAVQLYTGVEDSKVRRPVRELKGFEKVALNPGEEKEVEFILEGRSFAYYEPKIHGWFVEKGTVTVEVGSSSRDIRLTAKIEMRSEMELPMTVTRFTTIGELMNSRKGREFVTGFMAQMGMGGSAADTAQAARNKETDNAMGAGAERMRMQMMFEMPLNALVSYGIMKDDALDGIIEGLNA